MGVLDDTVLSINALNIESIASETCNCHPVSTEYESEWKIIKHCQEVCRRDAGYNNETHCGP
jgi:hypothetical protein